MLASSNQCRNPLVGVRIHKSKHKLLLWEKIPGAAPLMLEECFMKKEWKPPRGTRDLLPEEMALRNKIYSRMRRIFELYGYGEVCTPAFEDFELLAAKSGPEIEEEIYVFEDKSGRKLGLRFDPTVPIARIVATDPSLPKPVKFYYITRMWRYDRPQAGRYREFWQAGLELIGSKSPLADAEILAVANDLIRSVTDKEFTFKISSRKIVEEIAAKAGVPEDKKIQAFRALDKLPKIGEEEVKKEMERIGLNDKVIDSFLSMLNSKQADLSELYGIIEAAEKMGVTNIEIDLSIIRGIDYYTGFVFETLIKGKENLGSVCSGGRYDSLIKIYGGQDLPAVGFGLGIDRLLDAVELKQVYYPCMVYIAPANDDARDKAVEFTKLLRQNGVSAETDLMNRSLRKQLEYAASKKIPFVVIVGLKDLENNQVTVRDMATGKEEKIITEDLVGYFRTIDKELE